MLSGIVTLERFVHLKNVPVFIECIPFGISISVIPMQLLKAYSPIFVTLSGIIIALILEHPLNAEFPMPVTLFGIVTLERFVQ